MGGMDLDQPVAGRDRAAGAGGEKGGDRRDLRLRQRTRRGEMAHWLVGGRDDFPPRIGRALMPGRQAGALAPGMAQLDRRHGSGMGDGGGQPRMAGDLPILPQAEIARRDAAIGGDGGGFRHHHPRPPDRALQQMRQVPVGGLPVIGGAIHAHRGHPDAVGEGHAAQRQRVEQIGHR